MFIGLDISINSTGIVYYTDYIESIGFAVLNPQGFSSPVSGDIEQLTYDKFIGSDYSDSEICKILNGSASSKALINYLFTISKRCNPDIVHVTVEAPPPITGFSKFQSKSSSTLDMIRNNSIIVSDLIRAFDVFTKNTGIKSAFRMISNGTIKKESGNGRHKKEQVIQAFFEQDVIKPYSFAGKIDDIADAYFACKWRQNNIIWLAEQELKKK